MAIRAIWGAVLISALPLTGCGTVANLVAPGPDEGGKTPFGGVRQDVDCIHKAAYGQSGFWSHTQLESGPQRQLVPMLAAAADLPFSLLGDLFTWPYTASYCCINQPSLSHLYEPNPNAPAAPALGQPRPQPARPEMNKPEQLPSKKPEPDDDEDEDDLLANLPEPRIV